MRRLDANIRLWTGLAAVSYLTEWWWDSPLRTALPGSAKLHKSSSTSEVACDEYYCLLVCRKNDYKATNKGRYWWELSEKSFQVPRPYWGFRTRFSMPYPWTTLHMLLMSKSFVAFLVVVSVKITAKIAFFLSRVPNVRLHFCSCTQLSKFDLMSKIFIRASATWSALTGYKQLGIWRDRTKAFFGDRQEQIIAF